MVNGVKVLCGLLKVRLPLLLMNPLDSATPAALSTSATPELESLLLFGTGSAGFGGYLLTRMRARRRR